MEELASLAPGSGLVGSWRASPLAPPVLSAFAAVILPSGNGALWFAASSGEELVWRLSLLLPRAAVIPVLALA